MLITPPNLSALFTSFSMLYQSGFTTAEIFWRTLAMMVPSSTESTTYSWMEGIPAMREWLGPRVVQNVVARGPRVVINKPYELTLEIPKHKIEDDSYGLYSPLASAMGEQAAKWPDDLVASTFLANPTAFDGVPFYGTGHPVNMDDASKGTYDTLRTTFPLNLTNYGIAKAMMRARKAANGRYFGTRGTLLVVAPSNENNAMNILNSEYYPKLADGASLGNGDVAMVQNQWKGSADLLVIDQLEDSPLDWYLLDVSKSIKPIVFQLRQAPVFTYLNNPGDPNVFFNKMFIMGAEARGNADVTLPQLVFKGQAA